MDAHSSDGHCRTFGEGGDGYVSAEGVGAVLLKPLSQAVADGDSIYAVLKGSSINHVGAVSGITVPSPVAQGDMVADCLRKTAIDPETISYIEAHGTGTSLGDPIEIQGLNRAFREFTDKKQFCALGSVKSNVGHAESAAGIVGLTKAILQLHHKTLVKSLHSETINPYLDFASSPFYVQRTTAKWELSPQIKLRRAAISSFGATGSNAHIILEEFPQPQMLLKTEVASEVLVPLSAKNLKRLQQYAHRVVKFLQLHPQTDLASLAYTLQTGRVALEERLVVLVSSTEEIVQKFTAWLENPQASAGVWHARVKLSGARPHIFEADEDLQQAVQQWVAKGKLNKLAQLWIEGNFKDWTSLYQQTPQRIHLPTYPFAKDRYWISESTSQTETPVAKTSRSVVQEKAQVVNNTAKPNNISLTDTIEEIFDTTPIEKISSLTLSHATVIPEQATSPRPQISVYDYGTGVMHLQTSQAQSECNLSVPMVAELKQALVYLSQQEIKVLIVSGNDSWFLKGASEEYNNALEQQLYQELASFPVPHHCSNERQR